MKIHWNGNNKRKGQNYETEKTGRIKLRILFFLEKLYFFPFKKNMLKTGG
jgi:hypothetical protein